MVDLLVEQVECADVVVLNKADLVAPAQLAALRGIVEELMLDLMYDLPSQKSVKAFTITRAMVEEHTGGKVLPLPGAEQQKTA